MPADLLQPVSRTREGSNRVPPERRGREDIGVRLPRLAEALLQQPPQVLAEAQRAPREIGAVAAAPKLPERGDQDLIALSARDNHSMGSGSDARSATASRDPPVITRRLDPPQQCLECRPPKREVASCGHPEQMQRHQPGGDPVGVAVELSTQHLERFSICEGQRWGRRRKW